MNCCSKCDITTICMKEHKEDVILVDKCIKDMINLNTTFFLSVNFLLGKINNP